MKGKTFYAIKDTTITRHTKQSRTYKIYLGEYFLINTHYHQKYIRKPKDCVDSSSDDTEIMCIFRHL